MANESFSKDKIIITGSGKCGSTFLMSMLTRLGLETGYTEEEVVNQGYIGGLQWPIRGTKSRDPSPRIIKSPSLCFDLWERAERWGWTIDHVYVAIRKFEHSAEHRFERNKKINPEFKKKLERGWTEEEMREGIVNRAAAHVGFLMEGISEREDDGLYLPQLTFIRFPRMVVDYEYLYEKLSDIVSHIPKDKFKEVFDRTANPDAVHFGREDLVD